MCSVSSYYWDTTPKEDGQASVCLAAKYAYINNYSSLVLESFTSLLTDLIPDFLINATNSKGKETGAKKVLSKSANSMTIV